MNPARWLITAILVLDLAASSFAAAPPKPPSIPAPVAAEEGLALAQQLRNQMPIENSAGVIKIRDGKGQRASIPFRFQFLTEDSLWQAIYETVPANPADAEKLVVIHRADLPNQYLYARRGLAGAITPVPVDGQQPMVSFAGSDFRASDLGLDFLHWPGQRLTKQEMRRGRWCKVLESLNPDPVSHDYARVLSWIDSETGGLLRAEAYGRDDKLLKEFSVGSFKKVNGRWQLRDLEIRNEKTDSRTRLEFDLKSSPSNPLL